MSVEYRLSLLNLPPRRAEAPRYARPRRHRRANGSDWGPAPPERRARCDDSVSGRRCVVVQRSGVRQPAGEAARRASGRAEHGGRAES
eukprot:6849322-Prymnesium_polylepis.1